MNKAINDNLKSKNTKEKIITISIDEFQNKGYDNASMRKIAERVGIKASSIYNHFKSKEEILEEIFQYYRNVFIEEEIIFKTNEVPIDKMLKQGVYRFVQIIKKPEMINILKVIMKEQFKNEKIREFFLEEFIENPRGLMEQFMVELMKKGIIKEGDPYLLSQEFHAFSIYKMYEEFMLKDMNNINIDGLEKQISDHIDFFWNSIKASSNK